MTRRFPPWFETCGYNINDIEEMLIYCFLSFFSQLRKKFKECLSSKYLNINIFLKKEKDYRLSLYPNIFFEKEISVTNVYWKKTFNSLSMNFITSFLNSLLLWCLRLYSDFMKFHDEADILTSILCKNIVIVFTWLFWQMYERIFGQIFNAKQ